jgi:hypothetical protein
VRVSEDKEDHDAWAAMVLGASQPTLALGRQTSNCHVGQDLAWKTYFRRLLDDFFGDGAVLVSIFRKVAF